MNEEFCYAECGEMPEDCVLSDNCPIDAERTVRLLAVRETSHTIAVALANVLTNCVGPEPDMEKDWHVWKEWRCRCDNILIDFVEDLLHEGGYFMGRPLVKHKILACPGPSHGTFPGVPVGNRKE